MFDHLSERFATALKHLQGQGKLTESNIAQAVDQVKTALLEADVNFQVVRDLVARMREQALGQRTAQGVNAHQQFIKIVQDELTSVMGGKQPPWSLENSAGHSAGRPGPLPIVLVGLNGAGKTTFAAKLARWLTATGQTVLVAPADTFRPAAMEQLQVLCRQAEVDCLDSDLSRQPQEIALGAVEEAQRRHKKVVIVDTAGRFHVDRELMGQIREVVEALAVHRPEVWLVADAMTGQEAVNVATSFHQQVGLSGAVLSKMDSDARGGAALSIRAVTGVPIHFISRGEKLQDVELFYPDRLAARILDMGDVVSLVERAEQVMDQREAEQMVEKLQKNRFTINDFMRQMEGVSKMGSMGEVLKMLPGMGSMLRQVGDLAPIEHEMHKMRVVIGSMTGKERENDRLFNDSRIRRVAQGAGVSVSEVQGVLAKFRQMVKMMGGMVRGGGMGGQPGRSRKGKGKGRRRGKFGGGHFW